MIRLQILRDHSQKFRAKLASHRAVASAAGLRVVALLLGVAASVAIARLGGAEVKGIASAYAAANSLAFLVVNLDLAQQILRDGRNRQDLSSVPLRVMRLWPIYGALAVGGMLLSVVLGDTAIWLAIGTFAYMVGAQMGMIANALSGPIVTAWGGIVQQASMLIGALAVSATGDLTNNSVRFVVVASYAAPLPLFLWKALRHRPAPTRSSTPSRAPLRSLVRGGLSWQFARVAQFLMLRLDTLVVFQLLGASAAGVYSVGLATASLAGIVPAQFAANTTFEATMSVGRGLRSSAIGACVSGTAAAIALAFVGYPLIRIAYGQEFLDAYLVILAVLPGVVGYGVLQVFTAQMRLTGGATAVTIPSAAGATAMVAGMIAMVPQLELVGAGLASSLGPLVAIACILWMYRSADRNHPTALVGPSVKTPGNPRIFRRLLKSSRRVE